MHAQQAFVEACQRWRHAASCHFGDLPQTGSRIWNADVAILAAASCIIYIYGQRPKPLPSRGREEELGSLSRPRLTAQGRMDAHPEESDSRLSCFAGTSSPPRPSAERESAYPCVMGMCSERCVSRGSWPASRNGRLREKHHFDAPGVPSEDSFGDTLFPRPVARNRRVPACWLGWVG